jgi:hypothetical protein
MFSVLNSNRSGDKGSGLSDSISNISNSKRLNSKYNVNAYFNSKFNRSNNNNYNNSNSKENFKFLNLKKDSYPKKVYNNYSYISSLSKLRKTNKASKKPY